LENQQVKGIENSMIFQGVVTEDVCYEKECSRSLFFSEGKEYVIMAKGKQAVKDNLFVRKGQHMEIRGSVGGKDELEIIPDRARILLDKLKPERRTK